MLKELPPWMIIKRRLASQTSIVMLKMAIKKNVCGLNIVSDTNRLSDYSNFYFSFNGNPKYVEVCRCKEFLTRKYWIAVIVFLRISLDPRLDRSILDIIAILLNIAKLVFCTVLEMSSRLLN